MSLNWEPLQMFTRREVKPPIADVTIWPERVYASHLNDAGKPRSRAQIKHAQRVIDRVIFGRTFGS